MLSLIAYSIYLKLSEEFNFFYRPNSHYLLYSTEEPPHKIYFANEEVPLQDKQVAEKFSRELQIQTYWNSSKILLLKRAQHWLPQIAPILKQYKIPEDFKYLAVVESMLMDVESPKGAAGFWQILSSTGAALDLEINDEVDERYHPIKATHAACKYFIQSYRMFGNWTSVAASYNAGIGAISKAQRKQQEESFYKLKLNSQTAGYIFRAVALKQLIENPKVYGYKSRYNDNPYQVSLKRVKVTESIPDLTAFAAKHDVTIETLKKHNAWLLKNTLTIKDPEKTYTLLIPRQPDLVATTGQGASDGLSPIDSLAIAKKDTVSTKIKSSSQHLQLPPRSF